MNHNRTIKLLCSRLIFLVACMLLLSVAVAAESQDPSKPTQPGWFSAENKTYYYVLSDTGLTKATGLREIEGETYFFDQNGVMQTGWVKTSDGATRYFDKKGQMVTGAWVDSYYVDSTGKKLTNAITPDGYLVNKKGKKTKKVSANGWIKESGKYYYYDTAAKKFVTGKFKEIDGETYYFDADGVRVTGWQTIGRYRYYFNKQGERQTGKVTIKKKDYYFNSKGRLVTGKTVDGYTTDEDGVITNTDYSKVKKKKVLIDAGHGQGDVGATSSMGEEYLLTRAFAKMVYDRLVADGKVDATFYMDGSTSYDMYQRNKAALGGLISSVSGKGGSKRKVKKALKASSACPKLWEYDYVLEVHFNATAYASKDEGGDGKAKGFGIYINSYKSTKMRGIDKKIVSAVKGTGSVIWAGSGVVTSSTLLNARICNELGVNYSLIETAFIDDRDDMNFYNAKKKKMAKAVASAIEAFLS